jgi:hypothetical protein
LLGRGPSFGYLKRVALPYQIEHTSYTCDFVSSYRMLLCRLQREWKYSPCF